MRDNDRLQDQLRFIVEIDKLKSVSRRTRLIDGSRRENSAEHSWHLGIMAVLLAEYAPDAIDRARVLELVLLHDLVEIDAGDTFAYDVAGNVDRLERERAAADRLFGLLPPDQAARCRARWDEFEAGDTPEARFALALDRLQPLLQNVAANGGAWRSHGVSREQVLERMRPIRDVSDTLWRFVQESLEEVWERMGGTDERRAT
ncbi:MAG: HD domain-containing protein [Gemmatimonadota bacterium]|jgi:putative hydrolase of HD superfamily